jgi:hypothetical protein
MLPCEKRRLAQARAEGQAHMRCTAGDWGHSVPRVSSRPGGRALAARGGVPVATAGLRRRGGMGGVGALRHPWLHGKGLTHSLHLTVRI